MIVEADRKVRLYVKALVQIGSRQLVEHSTARAVGRYEALDALAGEHLARIDVAARVGGDHVQAEELAAALTHAPERANHLAVRAVQEPDVVVRQVRDEQI